MRWFRFFFVCLPLPAFAQVNLVSSNLPIVVIQTNGQTIPQDEKITAQMQVLYKGPGQRNFLTDAASDYNGYIGIERRGSTSDFFSEKKPYSIETRDADGSNRNYPLLGMPAESDWAFLAPYNDKSLVRDALMLDLARQIMPWASRTRFVELVLNGQYQGIYLVAEKIKRDKNRVNISKLKSTDLAGDSLTGGYILKIDKTTGGQAAAWVSPYPPYPGATQRTLFQVHYPQLEDIQPQQEAYIRDWITHFEGVMQGGNFADTSKGYPKLIDVQSFVDFTLLNELAKNVDCYRLSTFFWKDRDDKDPRLHAGPIWDFNIALGNVDYCNGDKTNGWAIDFNNVCPDDYWVNQFWWQRMWVDQQYRRRLKERWAALRAGPLSTDSIMYRIDSLSALLYESQSRNFQRWPVLYQYLWPNAFCCGSYDNHVHYLRNWILSRLEWMDAAAKALYYGEYHEEDRFTTQVFPNPAADELHFKMYLFHSDLVQLTVYDVAGRYITSDYYEPELNGESEWVWTHHLQPGAYFYRIDIDGRRESSGTFIIR